MNDHGSEILKDHRPIEAVFFLDSDETIYRADDYVHINAYAEKGPADWIPYICVRKYGAVIARFPAFMVTITYEELGSNGDG